MTVRATILLPTTAGRAKVLPLSVASVLRQTMADFELFLVGDGVTDTETRDVIDELVDSDERIQFVDNPKHPRRGEPHRHQLLTERASGQFVAYLCDRDLWFCDHLEHLEGLLSVADFAATRWVFFGNDRSDIRVRYDNLLQVARLARNERPPHSAPLSTVGHTMESYRRLPDGWCVTPPDRATDSYMWDQFYDQPWVEVAWSPVPTAVWLWRKLPQERTVDARRAAMDVWDDALAPPSGDAHLRQDIYHRALDEWIELDLRASRLSKWLQHRAGLGRRSVSLRVAQLSAKVRARSSPSVPNASDRSDTIDGSNGHSIPSSGSDQ